MLALQLHILAPPSVTMQDEDLKAELNRAIPALIASACDTCGTPLTEEDVECLCSVVHSQSPTMTARFHGLSGLPKGARVHHAFTVIGPLLRKHYAGPIVVDDRDYFGMPFVFSNDPSDAFE